MGYGMTLNTLFFDMDETLITGANTKYAIDHQRTWKAFTGEDLNLAQAAELNKNTELRVKKFTDKTVAEYWQAYGTNRLPVKEAIYQGIIKLFPETKEALEDLSSRPNVEMAIVSRSNHNDTILKADELKIKQYFNSIQGKSQNIEKAINKFPQLLIAYAQIYANNPTVFRNYKIIGDSRDDEELAEIANSKLNNQFQFLKVDRIISTEDYQR